MANLPEDNADAPVDFGSLLADFEREQGPAPGPRKRRGPRPGDTVKGRIVSLGAETAFIDLGGKSEGALSLAEFRDPDTGKLTVAIGDEIEATVVENDESGPVLKRQIGRGKHGSAELAQAFELGLPVEGLVGAVNKGGVEVQIAGVRAFCPISQLDLRHTADAAAFVGQRLQFRITRYEPDPRERGRDNVVVSRRALLEDESRANAAGLREKLQVGVVLPGTVSSLKDYGAFIDLGGIEGMLHVSEIGFARVGRPADVLAVGQSVQVQILRMEPGDDPKRPERMKIALSLKSLEKDPWADAKERFPERARLRGKVLRTESFGAFVEVAPGVEGLLHVSELSAAPSEGGKARTVKHAREALKIGETIDVVVIGVEPERRRIALGLARNGDEESSSQQPQGAPQRLGTFADLFKKKR